MKQRISADATVNTLLGQIKDPKEYVYRVYKHMHELRPGSLDGPDDVSVEIGLFSLPWAPDYRIQYFIGDETSRSYSPAQAFGERGHKPLPEAKLLDDDLWGRSTDYSEIRLLMGYLRGIGDRP